LIEYAKKKNIVVQAYSPLGSPGRPSSWDHGRYDVRPPDLLQHKGLNILEDKYGKTKAQLLLKYQHQRGNAMIVKSITSSRIISNADIFTWSIEDYDMDRLQKLESNWWRYCLPMSKLTVEQQEQVQITTYSTSTMKKERWIVRDEQNHYFPFSNEMQKRRKLAREKAVKYENAEKREEKKRLKRERQQRNQQGSQPNDGTGIMDNLVYGAARKQKKQEQMNEEMKKFMEKPKPKAKGFENEL